MDTKYTKCLLFLPAFRTKPVQNGLGLVNLETVMLQNMGFDAVQMLTGDMEQPFTAGAFQMKVPLAFALRPAVLIARAGTGIERIFAQCPVRYECIQLTVNGCRTDVCTLIFQMAGKLLCGDVFSLMLGQVAENLFLLLGLVAARLFHGELLSVILPRFQTGFRAVRRSRCGAVRISACDENL